MNSLKYFHYIHPIHSKILPKDELLMGDDNTPRKVLSTVTGKDTMYEIIQDNGDNYIVNSEHIISLKLSIQFIQK
jgi:hypothetical protein